MCFGYSDLGHLKGGELVQVVLQGDAANVRLLDSTNFAAFKRGARHRAIGGHARRSSVRLQVPHGGRWYLTVDHGGYQANTRWGVQVLPGLLPTLSEPPLSSVPSLVRRTEAGLPHSSDDQDRASYDVFISYASEDRAEVVRPLAEALQAAGLTVWYDEVELHIGDSLRRRIDRGLASSRFGVMVLSQAFFGKGWTNYELDGLVTRSVGGEQVLLPI
jgi:Domain of unknown function (DUF1883)/TIR domain